MKKRRKNQSSCAGLERSPTIVTKDKFVEYKIERRKEKTEGIDHYHLHHRYDNHEQENEKEFLMRYRQRTNICTLWKLFNEVREAFDNMKSSKAIFFCYSYLSKETNNHRDMYFVKITKIITHRKHAVVTFRSE